MGMRSAMVGVAAAAVVAAGLPAAASAGTLWRQITASSGANIDQVALLRAADGTLHVAWHIETSPSTNDMRQTPISSGGVVGTTTTVVSGWAALDNPALIPGPGGAIDALFGGIRTINFGETNQDLNSAISTDGGATWTLQPGDVAGPGAAAYASPVSATAVGPALTPYETWFGTSGVWVHTGLSPATPNSDYQGAFGCCGYDSNIAGSPSGTIELAWYSNATGHLGVYAQQVTAGGSPLGAPVNMPGTSNMSVGQDGRTPVVSTPSGVFYVAYATGYPALNRIRLWRVGAGSTTTLAKVPGIGAQATATVAAAPDGRLWVIWIRDVNDTPRVFAVRSNKTVTRFGAIVDAGAPPGAASGYRIDGSATTGSLDAFGSFSTGSSSGVATWYRRLQPGLSLAAKPGKLHRGRATKVTFAVTDAGDPVKGATVTVAGHKGTTGAKGEVKIQLSAQHSVKASVSAAGYVGATVQLRVGR
jgi:hypothetical protein